MEYPPFYLGFVVSSDSTGILRIANISEISGAPPTFSGVDVKCIDSWCDSTRIRFSFWRKAVYADDITWSAETLTFKCLIFEENLNII